MAFSYMHEAISAIGQAAGIDRLTSNADGVIQLVIEDTLDVYIR